MHVKKVDKIVLHLVTLELLPVFTVYRVKITTVVILSRDRITTVVILSRDKIAVLVTE